MTTDTAPMAPAPGLAAERSSSLRRTIAGAIRAARQLVGRRDGLVGVVIMAFFTILAIAPDLFVGPLQTAVTATGPRLAPPQPGYPLGTDELGRSMLNLTVHATRVSMVIGLLATVITVVLGAGLGILSGFVGGRTDAVIMRIADFFLVIPTFVLAIILTSLIRDALGTGSTELFGIRYTLFAIVIVVGITSWSSTARIIRSQTLSLKERPFVDRSRVIGGGGAHIMRRHILPNVLNLVVANTVLVFAGAVLTETTLSFIGLGDPFQPSWGQLLDAARQVGAPGLGAWWYFVPPGACIVLVVLAFTLVGGALDELLNPKLRGRR
jgi:peptide/nickel transport system permease protein